MQLARFVTDYDESLSGDSYIDPLGQLVIWSTFGAKIFNNRVNSISNDVRNYTLNLLNHSLIRDLITDDSVVIGGALAAEVRDKNSLSFKQACLIYLENCFTYALITADASAVLDTAGILGGANGRKQLDKDPILTLSHKADAHLLVRQLSLGVSGRYKTPFVEIGFFDGNYNYHLPKSAELWKKASVLFDESQTLGALYLEARKNLSNLISNSVGRSTKLPSHDLSELPSTLVSAYRKALSSPAFVGGSTRQFWLNATDLDQGAAGKLLIVLDGEASNKNVEELTAECVFQKAKQLCDVARETEESLKLEHIIKLEPLLAEIDLLFSLSLHKRHQSLGEVEALWRELGRDESTLYKFAASVRDDPSITNVARGTAKYRLDSLLSVAEMGTVEAQLLGILAYHAEVMRTRHQFPWVEISELESVKVNARTRPIPKKEAKGTWLNGYYFPQFRNLANGFRGIQV